MTLPPLPLIGGALFIDNSGWVEGMSTCHRLLQFKSLNLRIGAGERVALNFGSAIHLALELRYALYGNKTVDKQYYDDLTVILTDFFHEHQPPSEDWRGLNWAMETIRRYNDRFEQEEFNLLEYAEPIRCPHCDKEGQTPGFNNGPMREDHTFEMKECLWCRGTGKRKYMVELPFALPLFEWEGVLPKDMPQEATQQLILFTDGSRRYKIPIVFSGKIDLPEFLQGSLYTKDTKTSKQLGDMFWNEQRMSSQHRGYCWAFRELTGQEPKGYIVNAIRSSQPPDYVANGTAWKGKKKSPAQWWEESLQRERTFLQPGELDRWKHNTIDLVEEFFWHYARGYMPMKTKWCSQYGKCQYYDVCRLVPEDQGAFLASGLFADNKWSPLSQPTQAKQ